MEFQNFIQEVKERADLPTVLGRYLTLRKSGSRWVALCPFHTDHSPSLYITPTLGIYKCFVCGASGDVIRFVMELEKCSFIEALEILSKDLGLEVPRSNRTKEGTEEAGLALVAQAAHLFFQKSLKQSDACMHYLKQRGLHEETIRFFGLGYAAGGLLKTLDAENFSPRLQELTGFRRAGYNQNISPFEGRLMFPIFSVSGRVVGFGGRTLQADQKPKYINSPESHLYKKSQVLYGLHAARSAVARENSVLLVEGYMDVISLWQAGYKNVCAVSGTALSASQAGQLRRFCDKVYLCLDGDKAGRSAILRNIPELLKAGLEVRVPWLSSTEDPDSLIQSQGREVFDERLAKAENLPQFLFRQLGEGFRDKTPEEKEAIYQNGLEALSPISNDFVREEYRKQWHILLDRPYLRAHVQKPLGPQGFKKADVNPAQKPERGNYTGEGQQASGATSLPRQKLSAQIFRDPEWKLVRLLVFSKDLALEAMDKVKLEWLENEQAKEVVDHLFAYIEEKGTLEVSDWLTTLPENPKIRVEWLIHHESFASGRENFEFVDTLTALEKKSLTKQMRLLTQKVGQGLLVPSEGMAQQRALQQRLLQINSTLDKSTL